MVSGVPRKTVLAIKGLVTTPNEYGVYPEGSAYQMENLMARSANQWIGARDTEFLIQSGPTSYLIYRVFGIAPGVYASINVSSADYTTGWAVYLNGNSATAFTLQYPLTNPAWFDPNGYLTPLVARNRIFLNSRRGVSVCDTNNPQSAGERLFRTAGLTQPRLFGVVSDNFGKTLPRYTYVTYQAIWRRRTADGYVLISPPSAPQRFANLISDCTFTVRVRFESGTVLKVGDEIELYRSAGINDPSGSDPDTGVSCRLVGVHVVVPADISGATADIVDAQPMSAPLYETSGAEIYTSPYQEGATGANLPPPVCRAMTAWGVYTFYGNITDDPTWTFDVPAGVFSTYATAADNYFVRTYGVGQRNVTGTRTAGSPTITGVSAAHLYGIAPGQRCTGSPGFPFGTQVVSVGASSITMSANTNSPGTGVITEICDVLDVNGYVFLIEGMASVLFEAQQTIPRLAAYPSEVVNSGVGFSYESGITITFRPSNSGIGTSINVRGTSGQNYSPAIPDIASTAKTITQTERPNLLRWSKPNQPEHVPTPNEAFVGNGKIIRMFPTTDALIILCTDGAYRLTGEAGVWRTDLVDATFVPCAPDACCVLNDIVYAYTGRGFCSLQGVQTSLLSRGVIDAEFPGRQFEEIRRIHMHANPTTEEVITVIQSDIDLSISSVVYVYSTLYKQWSTFKPPFNVFTSLGTFYPSVSGGLPSVLFGEFNNGSAPSVSTWSPDSGEQLAFPFVGLHPFYDGNPATLKQWIDATWIIDNAVSASGRLVYQYINRDVSSGIAVAKYPIADDAGSPDRRATCGIVRRVSINPTLSLAAYLFDSDPNAPPIVLKGVSIRYVPLTTQQKNK